MYFYIDESGNSGANLFDPSQPILYYGVLSSKVNLDILVEAQLQRLRSRLGVGRIHAAELTDQLALIVPDLLQLIKEYKLIFDIYRVVKADYAIISFFDQVFDQGNNPAVPWMSYWTPIRYVLLIKISRLFDQDILKMAWSARIESNNQKAEAKLIEVCRTIQGRIDRLPDERSRQIIGDVLQWAIDNPRGIGYNSPSGGVLQLTPNLIGFQFVLLGMAFRINKQDRKAAKIVVDQQLQFNNAQKILKEFYVKAPNDLFSIYKRTGFPSASLKGIPSIPISSSSSKDSAGLELVDIFLWVFQRKLEGKPIAKELLPLFSNLAIRCNTDQISLEAIEARWTKVFAEIPEPTQEEKDIAELLIKLDEERRQHAIKKGNF